MHVKQKDIAARLGVSVSLVSRALSGTAGGIGASAATVLRIRELASQMGYTPSAAATSLRGTATRIIGVVVLDFADPFFGPLIAAIHRAARERGYSLALAGFERRRPAPSDLQALLRFSIDGLIIAGSGDGEQWIDTFLERGVTVARIGAAGKDARVPVVGTDDRAGVGSILDHLVSLGHRAVGFVGANSGPHSVRATLFREEAHLRGLPVRTEWIRVSREHVSTAGLSACRALLKTSRPLPTAIVASSDIVALGALRSIADAGLRVPRDISLAGYDDIPVAQLVSPPLTTVRQPVDELAKTAFSIVTRDKFSGILFKPELVVRGSTGRNGD